MDEYLNKSTRELKLRNYSPKTTKAYTRCLHDYLLFKKLDFPFLDEENIKDFLLRKQASGKAPQTINLYLNAIKFFYRNVLQNKSYINLKFSKRSKKLPIALSKQEIEKIISVIQNMKHKLMITIGYGSGLRVSEVVNLRTQDIDFDALSLHIKGAKGMKDRITIFPKKIIGDLRSFTTGKTNTGLVFESERGGKLTTTTAQVVFKQAIRKAGITKPATSHSLRHSFAIHLLENEVDVRYVQELLGHANIRTTQIYTQVTNPKLKNIESPFRTFDNTSP